MNTSDKDLRLLTLVGITYNQASAGVYALILKEAEGDRKLPIVIGSPEAQSIECKLQEIIPPRPLTHDLMTNIMRAYGMQLSHVVIKRLDSGVYAADLYLNFENEERIIDSRSSDAIALAIRMGAPIFAPDQLLESSGMKEAPAPSSQAPRNAGSTRQVKKGKDYSRYGLAELQLMLADAIDGENYEEAAIIKKELQNRTADSKH